MLNIALVQALIQMILGIVSGAGIKGIPEGVNSFITNLTADLPNLVAAGADVKSFLDSQFTLVQQMVNENRDPTQAEWDALDDAKNTELRKLRGQATPPTE
jgi:hypothetical protein